MADDVGNNFHKIAPEESPGARLKKARKSKKLTTRQIAKDLHMDSWMLDAIERQVDIASAGAVEAGHQVSSRSSRSSSTSRRSAG